MFHVCIFRTMSNRPTNREKSVERTVWLKNGKTYKSEMSWNAGPSALDRQLAETSESQRDVLQYLLCEMVKTPPPNSYRRYATIKPAYTIVEKTVGKCNYRIDNQMKLNLSSPDPRLNIQYQIGNNSHAMVLVRMRPIACPPDITVGLIDEDQLFGFSPRTVMGFIEDSLRHSADKKCYTYIEWTIRPKEDRRERSRSRSGSRNRSRDTSRNKLQEYGPTIELGTKVVAKVSADVFIKTSAKKVPLIGLGCALLFGIGRLITGDPLGALGEVASGAASCIPGVGTAASIGIDAVLYERDMKK